MDKQTIVTFECDRKQCRVCMGECRHTTNVRRLDGNQQRARIVERTSKGCDIEGAKQK